MNTLKAEKRNMDTKAKKLRREGFVTGVVFGREMKESIPVKMAKADVERLIKTNKKGSQIMLDVGGQLYDVLIKEIDYNPLKGQVDEIDFQELVNGEKVHSVAEVQLLNHEKVTTGVLQQVLEEISYRAVPAALVEKIQIDVGSLRAGDTLKVRDLEIASNPDIELTTDLDAVVVTVTAARNAEETAGESEDTEKTE